MKYFDTHTHVNFVAFKDDMCASSFDGIVVTPDVPCH
jgi:hypothetical protein